jgi:hypothetical protein
MASDVVEGAEVEGLQHFELLLRRGVLHAPPRTKLLEVDLPTCS